MDIPFLAGWRRRRETGGGTALRGPGVSSGTGSGNGDGDDGGRAAGQVGEGGDGLDELLAECELLRARAEAAGVGLDGSPGSLSALDQIPPRWREDPEELSQLGNDAGLYLGTVLVRTVPGARWHLWPDVGPMVRLPSGRELDVVRAGTDWAATGVPELSQLYAEAAET
ncbi:DUF6278 family protein [Streptomyces zingiberis]|uniref:Uncharacterized protein n=1 Tax=Streptomyces zingiberis TaxID=2053010 RepID=A0ABX1BYP6_9ACTN|nr:DUF6278 family protein [Streptomyces zingiberis]NJQ02819.1 hypothetical protein [Streptomyces zingiberis]